MKAILVGFLFSLFLAVFATTALADSCGWSPAGCNQYGCWQDGGGCNQYGCWVNRGGCNQYGCWSSPRGGCNQYGCDDVGVCNQYGCP
jgi:hypothetical protein